MLWLDQLDHYLVPGGLTLSDVRHIVSAVGQRTVIATVRPDLLSQVEAAGSAYSSEFGRLVHDARQVWLRRAFSADELERARSRTGDPRIEEALQFTADYGLAEYLGASLTLYTHWRSALEAGPHARGALLVRAAVDCRRLGLTRVLGRELLQDLHTAYLADRPRLQHEPLAAAWDWSTERRVGTLSLLLPRGGGESAPVDVFPHLVTATKQHEEQSESPPRWVRDDVFARVLDRTTGDEAQTLATSAHTYGRRSLARRAYQHALDASIRRYGAADERTLLVHTDFARWLHLTGDFPVAERLARTVLQARRHEWGAEHPTTLAARHLLALIMFETGQPDTALAECETVLSLQSRLLGADHPDTLHTRFTLDALRGEQEPPQIAVARLQSDLNARINHPELGEHHPATLTTRFALAVTLWQTGQSLQALQECRTVLHGRRRTLAPGHSHTLDALYTLATWLEQSGEATQAAAAFAELHALQRQLALTKARDSIHELRRHLEGLRGRYPEAGAALRDLDMITPRLDDPDRDPDTLRYMLHNLTERCGAIPHLNTAAHLVQSTVLTLLPTT
ncbi:tetratricopeptide repeat protein [Streptomyces sp. NBC_01613]|uniref:tetratricopeptide repeat protein n=1 Tax=Streptomyces sp. NBC_01613 TaxID=2975896 RepID=UPI00386F86F5